jgi:hypothetical protein
MTEYRPEEAQNIVGPRLAELGFTLDSTDNNVDEGGRRGSAVYYRSDDCRIQLYESARAGSINCMIAPISAANTFGPLDRSGDWQHPARFSPTPDMPIGELVKLVSYELSRRCNHSNGCAIKFLNTTKLHEPASPKYIE